MLWYSIFLSLKTMLPKDLPGSNKNILGAGGVCQYPGPALKSSSFKGRETVLDSAINWPAGSSGASMGWGTIWWRH